MENLVKGKPNYRINEDKTVTVLGGEFDGVILAFSNFEKVWDYNEKTHLISYDYSIIKGDIGINEGEEIKNLMRSIINDIIESYKDKEN